MVKETRHCLVSLISDHFFSQNLPQLSTNPVCIVGTILLLWYPGISDFSSVFSLLDKIVEENLGEGIQVLI